MNVKKESSDQSDQNLQVLSKVITKKGAGSLHSDNYMYVCMLSSQNGVTPLYIASQQGHSQVAEVLLSKGADVNLPEQVQYV